MDKLTVLQESFDKIRYNKKDTIYTQFLMEMIGVFESIRYTIDEEGEYHFHTGVDWTPYIDFHYRIMTDPDPDIDPEFRHMLFARFNYHGENGGAYLLDKLDKQEHPEYNSHFIIALGSIYLDQIYKKRKGEKQDKALAYARQFATSPDDRLREKAIIVIGWLGNDEDIPFLKDHILNDPDPRCRSYSGTAFRFLRIPDKESKAFPVLYTAIQQETDPEPLSSFIDVTQELAKKKWLPQHVVYDKSPNAGVVEQARAKALRYLKKIGIDKII